LAGNDEKKKRKNFRLDFHIRFKSKQDSPKKKDSTSTYKNLKKRFSFRTESKEKSIVLDSESSVYQSDTEPSENVEISHSKPNHHSALIPEDSDKTLIQENQKTIVQKISGFLKEMIPKVAKRDKVGKPPIQVTTVSTQSIVEVPITAPLTFSTIETLKNTIDTPVDTPVESRRISFQSNSISEHVDDRAAHGRIDQVIEKVSFSGIFSVSTTSTKSPKKIRLDILRVLDLMISEFTMQYFEEKGAILVIVGKNDFEDFDAYSISSSRRQSIAWSIYSPSKSDRSILDTEKCSKMFQDSKKASNIVFQLRICKISMMNMHCIRFHLIEGDTWVYKTASSHMNISWCCLNMKFMLYICFSNCCIFLETNAQASKLLMELKNWIILQ
jgi:hypothetical protein